MPAWSTPKQDFALNDIVTASHLNAIGENLAYLKEAPARAKSDLTPASIDSSTWTVRATLSLTTRGGDLLAGFSVPVYHAGGGRAHFDIALDGTRVALNGASGSLELTPGGSGTLAQAALQLLLTGVPSGAHAVTLQWKTDAAGLNMHHGQFYAVEL